MDPQQALEKYFGFREFREPQGEVISGILNGQDVFVVMPTGGGKSLCYQLPAILRDGVTVVVSPLVALMKDQVDALVAQRSLRDSDQQHDFGRRSSNNASAECERASSNWSISRRNDFAAGLSCRLLGKSPSGCSPSTKPTVSPSGATIFGQTIFGSGSVLEELGRPQVAAFTATATPEVRTDIVKRLGLENPSVFVAGFARPNLRFVGHRNRAGAG